MLNIADIKIILTLFFVLIYGISLLFSLPQLFNNQGEIKINLSQGGNWLIFRFALLIPIILVQTI